MVRPWRCRHRRRDGGSDPVRGWIRSGVSSTASLGRGSTLGSASSAISSGGGVTWTVGAVVRSRGGWRMRSTRATRSIHPVAQPERIGRDRTRSDRHDEQDDGWHERAATSSRLPSAGRRSRRTGPSGRGRLVHGDSREGGARPMPVANGAIAIRHASAGHLLQRSIDVQPPGRSCGPTGPGADAQEPRTRWGSVAPGGGDRAQRSGRSMGGWRRPPSTSDVSARRPWSRRGNRQRRGCPVPRPDDRR